MPRERAAILPGIHTHIESVQIEGVQLRVGIGYS